MRPGARDSWCASRALLRLHGSAGLAHAHHTLPLAPRGLPAPAHARQPVATRSVQSPRRFLLGARQPADGQKPLVVRVRVRATSSQTWAPVRSCAQPGRMDAGVKAEQRTPLVLRTRCLVGSHRLSQAHGPRKTVAACAGSLWASWLIGDRIS